MRTSQNSISMGNYLGRFITNAGNAIASQAHIESRGYIELSREGVGARSIRCTIRKWELGLEGHLGI